MIVIMTLQYLRVARVLIMIMTLVMMVVLSNDDCISGTCIAPHLFSCCPHHRMHPSEIPVYCNMITLVVVAEIDKMNMTIKKTDMMRMIKLSMKTTMTMTNLLPAGEKLRPDQLGVELLLWRLEGACLVRRVVKIS